MADPRDDPPSDGVTRHLRRYASGDRGALDQVLPLVYAELHRLADGMFRRGGGVSLQPTALVHEAYLKLAGASPDLDDRQHFLALAARAMRQVLANHARDRSRDKRGGAWNRVTLGEPADTGGEREVDLVALHEALASLEANDPRKAEVAQMRFLSGMTIDEVARALGVSTSTVESDWALARAWLARRLADGEGRA